MTAVGGRDTRRVKPAPFSYRRPGSLTEAVAALADTRHGALSDRAHLAALDRQLQGFDTIDWPALARQDPSRAQALWVQCEQTAELRAHYAAAVAHHGQSARMEAARHAAERMAALPERCVVVEDSPLGVQAAVAAGMDVYGFTAMTPAERLTGATRLFSDLGELADLLV